MSLALDRGGRIDILHNNVGGTDHGRSRHPHRGRLAARHRPQSDERLPRLQACVARHAEQGAGAIVNVSSLASVQINAYPYFGYLSAKAGLNHFTRALAVHYAPHGIRANAVLPGVMDTPLIHRDIAGQFADTEDMLAKRHAASPMGRMGDAWDVAYASLFLASDEAKYITGVCLPVDGGKSCWGR